MNGRLSTKMSAAGAGELGKDTEEWRDQSTLHIYIWRQYNETHQTLFEKGEKVNRTIREGENFPSTLYMLRIIIMKPPHVISIW
jgi:hypothetical protein